MPIKSKKVVVSKKETASKKPRKATEKKLIKKVGRPSVITDETLGKLRDAFSYTATDEEACIYAGIHPDTLYEYCKNFPEFSEEKERLKNMPNFTAKKVIIAKIQEGDEKQANWWLERKAKQEFSTRQEVTGKDGENITAVNFVITPIKKK